MPDFKKNDVIFYKKIHGAIACGKAIVPTSYTLEDTAVVIVEDIAKDDENPPPFCHHALYESDIICHFDGTYNHLCDSEEFLEEFCRNLSKNFKSNEQIELKKVNLCESCDKVIPQGKAFCDKCEKELNEELNDKKDTYPCVGCGREIPATEPYCKDCEKKMERALAA